MMFATRRALTRRVAIAAPSRALAPRGTVNTRSLHAGKPVVRSRSGTVLSYGIGSSVPRAVVTGVYGQRRGMMSAMMEEEEEMEMHGMIFFSFFLGLMVG